MKRLSIAFVLLLSAVTADACQPRMLMPQDQVRAAARIYVGYVVGERYGGYERELARGEDPERVPLNGERTVTVVPTEPLKGDLPAAHPDADVPCGDPAPHVFDRAVVIEETDGSIWAISAGILEDHLRRALGKQ